MAAVCQKFNSIERTRRINTIINMQDYTRLKFPVTPTTTFDFRGPGAKTLKDANTEKRGHVTHSRQHFKIENAYWTERRKMLHSVVQNEIGIVQLMFRDVCPIQHFVPTAHFWNQTIFNKKTVFYFKCRSNDVCEPTKLRVNDKNVFSVNDGITQNVLGKRNRSKRNPPP